MRDKHRTESENELKRNWVVIASLAWKGYQNMGCGYLLIDELPPKRMRYLTIKEDMPETPGASKVLQDWAKDIEDLVKKYNPKKEIIVAVWLSDNAGKGGIYNFHLSQKPYPPAAYKMRKDVFERN